MARVWLGLQYIRIIIIIHSVIITFLQLFVVNTATDSLLDIPQLRLEGSASISTSCGIHTIGASEERRYLATGGEDPTHLAIYGLPEMQPLAIGEVGILCCA